MNAVTGQVYVVNQAAGTVSVIDGVSNMVTSVTVGGSPFGVAVNAVIGQVYVANAGDNTMSVIDGQGTQGVPIGITTQASATVPSPYSSSAATATIPYTKRCR
jgi:YVTN family beta-propeller protein